MRIFLFFLIIFLTAKLTAQTLQIPKQKLNGQIRTETSHPPILVPTGVLSNSPIISDATFAIIAKKNNLSEKDFSGEDLKKLDLKFNKVIATLKKEKVFEKIAQIAPKYGVSQEAIAACIIGEHVFNVTITDKFQSYFVDIYSKWLDKHNQIRSVYLKFLSEPDIDIIIKSSDLSDYEKWDTIFDIYNKKYRGNKRLS